MTDHRPGNASRLAGRLTLASKLYAIFALFALLTAAIAMLSDYNSRRSADLTAAIETANAAALNVERVNSLVYAVVMESRGIYMSTEPAVVKRYGEGLLKFNAQIREVVKGWEKIVQADDAEQFATFKKRIEQFVEFRAELVRRGIEIGPAAGREWGDNDANRAVRSALNKDLEALSKVYTGRAREIAQQTETNRMMSLALTCLAGLALALVVIGVVIIARSIARPLSAITETIKLVADGADNVTVPHTARTDEIGALAGAIQIFQEAMNRNRSLASQVSRDSAAREQRARHIEQSVEAFREAIGAVMRGLTDNAAVMRETAQTITRVTSNANGRAGTARRENREHSDRPAAGDENPLAEHFARPARRMQRHRQRFAERRFAGRQAIGRHALDGIGDKHLAEGALDMRKGHGAAVEAHVEALVVQPFLAIAAGPAWPRRRHGDELADVQPLDAGSERLHIGRDLVAEDHRLAQPHRAEAAVIVIVQVAAADAANGEAKPDFAGARCLD